MALPIPGRPRRSCGRGGSWGLLRDSADEPERDETERQLDRFDEVLRGLGEASIDVPLRHAANSAGTIAHDRAHYDLVRCGIAVYGLTPGPGVAGRVPLQPVMSWRTSVSFVKRVRAGEAVSYGHREHVDSDTTIATIPVG